MYSKILIPLDGSKFAEAVLPYARLLAQDLNIPVDLLCVNDPHDTTACAPYMVNEYLATIGASFGGIRRLDCRIRPHGGDDCRVRRGRSRRC